MTCAATLACHRPAWRAAGCGLPAWRAAGWGLPAWQPGSVAMAGWLLALALMLLGMAAPARAALELQELSVERQDGVSISFNVRPRLPAAVDEALQRGIPLYFVAEATLYRSRWYWRDERVARVRRTWRLSYQPLTATWRVSTGGLHQTYDNASEALTAISRATRWRVAEPGQTDPDERYYVEFDYRLDTSQLPRPMQIGVGGQADWALAVEHTVWLP